MLDTQAALDRLVDPAAPLAERLGAEAVLPRYDGLSIANLPATIGTLLGVERGWASPPLAPGLLEPSGGYRRVVLLLVDGVGWNRLARAVAVGDAPIIDRFERAGARIAPLTSVSPATTSVATTTLYTPGATPAEHGLIGYTALLPELGAICNLLFWHPAYGRGSLEEWGLEPENFLPVASIAQTLAAGGATMQALVPQEIIGSPLSRVTTRGATVTGYAGEEEMWAGLARWLAAPADVPSYLYVYFTEFDTLSHLVGPDAPEWRALWRRFAAGLERFLDALPVRSRDDTLLLISADHGHMTTPRARRVLLADHPALLEHLVLMPAGEPRHAYLYARAGHERALADYLESHLARDFFILSGKEAIAGGLYGNPARAHPELGRRLGDYIVIPRGDAMLWPLAAELAPGGMHGGLHPDEMVVPLIALPLDRW